MSESGEQIVLALETAIEPGGVSILKNSLEVASWRGTESIARSEDLMPEIERLLEDCKITAGQIDLIGVSLGPGSYTGIRIGIATAAGLAFGSDCPSIGVSTLEALALAAEREGTIRCLIPAGRGRIIYQDFYKTQADGLQTTSVMRETSVEALVELASISHSEIIVLEEKLEILHSNLSHPHKIRIGSDSLARSVGLLAISRYRENVSTGLKPLYGRDFAIGGGAEK